MREEEGETSLLDLDDATGSSICKSYLCCIESLLGSLDLPKCDRTYRDQFSHSYQELYKQMREQFNSECAYLPEILDSAQEAFDHLWVNGEKYVFSPHVLESGNELFAHFQVLREYISEVYLYNFEHGIANKRKEFTDDLERLKKMVARFDELWTIYEHKYVYELMVIENDARRFIIESINLEAALMMLARKGKSSGQGEFDKKREEMLGYICQINSVANVEGKGRDDFQWALMQTAENILRVEKDRSKDYSSAVSDLADKVRTSFNAYRVLMQKYQKNIEIVDPQLKNNQELIEVLTLFEESWGLAGNQLGSTERIEQLNSFSKLICKTGNEHKEFKEQVECRDASIFMSIPSLLVY